MKRISIIAAALVCLLPARSHAQATSFIDDGGYNLEYDAGFYMDAGAIPVAPKTDYAQMPSVPPSQKVIADEVNKYRGALYDTRTAIKHGYTHGLAPQSGPPAPPTDGVILYDLWDGGLYDEYPDAGSFPIGGLAGWQSWICDFSSQSATQITSNGTLTTCGAAWAGLVNFSATVYADSIRVVPDAGVEINTHGTGSSSNEFSVGTNPGISLLMTAIDPTWDSDTTTRICGVWNSVLDAGATQDCWFSIDNGAAGDNAFDWGWGAGIYSNTSPTVGRTMYSDTGATAVRLTTAATAGAVTSAECVTFVGGPYAARPMWRYEDGGWNSGSFPTVASMQELYVSTRTAGNTDISAYSNPFRLEIDGAAISGKSYACTLRAIRVEWKQ